MTVYPFAPSTVSNFQFQPTLDGQTFNVITTWNIPGARWYVNILTLDGALVYCMPLIGSVGYNISLLPQLNPYTGNPWTSTLIYNSNLNQFEVSP